MPYGALWSITEFAKLSHISRHQLLHYDEVGLLSPASRGAENKYRYYHSSQMVTVKLIRIFQRLGMTLDEIKQIKDKRTPEVADSFFKNQISKIDSKIDEWASAKKLLHTLHKSIKDVQDVDDKAITIKHLPAEAIILGDLNDFSQDRDEYAALSRFYSNMGNKYPGLDMNYSAWGRFSMERIKNRDWKWPDRYYFHNPEGYDKRPAALYAIGYTRGGYGQSSALYERLLKYIDEQGYEICGDAYEEYPLNEVCIVDENNYLMRVLITVQKKQPDGAKPRLGFSTMPQQRPGRLNRR